MNFGPSPWLKWREGYLETTISSWTYQQPAGGIFSISIFRQAQLPSLIAFPHPKPHQSKSNLQKGILKAGFSPTGTWVCQTVKQFVNDCLKVVQLLFLHHFPFHLLNLYSLLLLVMAGSMTSWHTAALSAGTESAVSPSALDVFIDCPTLWQSTPGSSCQCRHMLLISCASTE